ncbi:4-(cytidine 5'-diphospho)-2-C-methyl-D-erythritol kinase [Ligilactobacillus cholophilus]|uniref:4-(cytidine 5'-diphospho)-2-C-methyl-D-erythritol kinase n=1 Tax=Ligilactobacillus cholophilus TaxID=3050131 RepID=UPI0025B1E027|nr:4-(cytidine 5'-diphospho)-2-C-methyl-D-erythritol kinase [Ligilactobacillus cholophilus]
MEILEKAPAKLNLSLDALFRHLDGDPEWKMVMTAIDLADYVYLDTNDQTNEIIVQTNTGFLPQDRRNLAYQAARTLQKKFNINAGVTITIEKKIPVSAGMGGGSADAGAVLRGLNKLWNLNLSLQELAEIGLEIDSDVPFCVYSCPALVEGKGEKITPIGSLNSLWFVVAKPQASVSTPSILKQIDFCEIQHLDVQKVVDAIHNQDWNLLFQSMGNSLEPITTQKYPEITNIKEKMVKFGAQVAQMSGTGPTVFGITQTESRAQHIYNSLRGFCKEVYLVRPFNLTNR